MCHLRMLNSLIVASVVYGSATAFAGTVRFCQWNFLEGQMDWIWVTLAPCDRRQRMHLKQKSTEPALVQRLVFPDSSWSRSAYSWWWLQADTDPMSVKCWACTFSVARCCRQRNGSICLFHKCAYYRLLEGLWQALLQTGKCTYLLISEVCSYILLERLWQVKESAVTPAKRKYILDLQVSTYNLLATLLHAGQK